MSISTDTKVFGFFFILVIMSGLFLLLGQGLHFISYDYGIDPVAGLGQTLLNSSGNATTGALNTINILKGDFLSNSAIFDMIFLTFFVSIFIESCIAAIKTRRLGWMSFFGFITLGNILLGLIIYFALQIRGWILTEIFYNIITETFTATWSDYFINNTWTIVFFWYLIIITLSFINVDKILSKIGLREKEEQEFNNTGGFEE